MLKFKTSCAVLAYLSSNLLNEVGLSLFRYFEVGLRVWDIVVKKFTFAISSPDEFLYFQGASSADFPTVAPGLFSWTPQGALPQIDPAVGQHRPILHATFHRQ